MLPEIVDKRVPFHNWTWGYHHPNQPQYVYYDGAYIRAWATGYMRDLLAKGWIVTPLKGFTS